MCLAIPGQIVSLDKGLAIVDYRSEKREAIAKGIEVAVGDFVLVQFGMVVEKLDPLEAKTALKEWEAMQTPPR